MDTLHTVTFIEDVNWTKQVLYCGRNQAVERLWDKIKFDITRLLSPEEFRKLQERPLPEVFEEIERQISIRKRDLWVPLTEETIH